MSRRSHAIFLKIIKSVNYEVTHMFLIILRAFMRSLILNLLIVQIVLIEYLV